MVQGCFSPFNISSSPGGDRWYEPNSEQATYKRDHLLWGSLNNTTPVKKVGDEAPPNNGDDAPPNNGDKTPPKDGDGDETPPKDGDETPPKQPTLDMDTFMFHTTKKQ